MKSWIRHCVIHGRHQFKLISKLSDHLRKGISIILLTTMGAVLDILLCLALFAIVLLTTWWLPPLRFKQSRDKLRKAFDSELASITEGQHDTRLTQLQRVMKERLRIWPNDPDFYILLAEIENRQHYLRAAEREHTGRRTQNDYQNLA